MLYWVNKFDEKGRIWLSVLAYFFPPVCPGCGERRSPTATGLLCDACLARWHAEINKTCTRCGYRMSRCVCQPRDGVIARSYPVFAMGAYRHGTVVERLILAGKRLQSKALFSFLAEALAKRLADAGVRGGAHTVITYVPRNARHKRVEGQDQGALLADALGAAMGSQVICGIRNSGVRSQKRLKTPEDRMLRAARIYRPREALSQVTGKTVILLDDVCTAGGSLYACQALLRQAGATRVICAVIGKVGC